MLEIFRTIFDSSLFLTPCVHCIIKSCQFFYQGISETHQLLFTSRDTILTHASLYLPMDLPDGSAVKNLPANAGDKGSIPGSGRSPGEGNGNPLQYSCLGNPMDRGTLWARVHGVPKNQV